MKSSIFTAKQASILAAVSFISTLLFWQDIWSVRQSTEILFHEATAHERLSFNLDLPRLKEHGVSDLEPAIELTTIHMRVKSSNMEPPIKQDLGIPLPPSQILDAVPISDSSLQNPPQIAIIDVDVPLHRIPADGSSIIFGVATTMERLNQSLPTFASWMAGTNTRLIAIVQQGEANDTSDSTYMEVMETAEAFDLTLAIIEPGAHNSYVQRYAQLPQILYEYATSDTKWIGVMDDDTYFPSMKRLVGMLSKYDANKPHFVGGVSENFHLLRDWGFIAYGGAGIFMSIPLLEDLQGHISDCVETAFQGDGAIAECVYKYSSQALQVELGLHQLDIRGDHSGFYEAVRDIPISVHHWKSWVDRRIDMASFSLVGRICGQECFLQKYYFSDGWLLTNGYSIIKYSDDRLESASTSYPMENTWGEGDYAARFPLLSPKDERKIQYFLESSIYDDATGAVVQYYVRRIDDVAVGIIRLVWTK